MSTAHRIIAEGLHSDGTWEQDPPAGYTPTRFSIDEMVLATGDAVELRIGAAWVPAIFRGLGSSSHFVVLDLALGYDEEAIEGVVAPIDAQFRIPKQTEEVSQ
ncbi:MAG: hypothetical protein AAFQ17_01020 [Pseudomonadota bacterium]